MLFICLFVVVVAVIFTWVCACSRVQLVEEGAEWLLWVSCKASKLRYRLQKRNKDVWFYSNINHALATSSVYISYTKHVPFYVYSKPINFCLSYEIRLFSLCVTALLAAFLSFSHSLSPRLHPNFSRSFSFSLALPDPYLVHSLQFVFYPPVDRQIDRLHHTGRTIGSRFFSNEKKNSSIPVSVLNWCCYCHKQIF